MYLHDELKHENAQLKQLLTKKNEEVRRLENSRKELEVRYTNLKMARTISIHDKDINDTKQRLSRLGTCSPFFKIRQGRSIPWDRSRCAFHFRQGTEDFPRRPPAG